MKNKQSEVKTENKKSVGKRLSIDEVIAYQCHVRGLTFDVSSPVKNKGTYMGIVERLDSIKEMGVNQLILMPSYEFNDNLKEIFGAPQQVCDEELNKIKNYWGFASGDYFTPKKSYSAEDSSKEFKMLVEEAHIRSMEIVTMMYFPVDINTEVLLNSLKHWVREYDVDGFFLNVNSYYLKVISDCSELSEVKLYNYEADEHLNYTNPDRIAVYDYEYRKCLRKMLRGDEDAFKEFIWHFKNSGNIRRIISVTSHNGFTLFDLYTYGHKYNEANGEYNRDGEEYNYGDNCGFEGIIEDEQIKAERLKRMKNALVMLLLSKGMPMLLAGDEEANSQNGNNNAYCQDNEISWIQYGSAFSKDLKAMITNIIKIRNVSGVFDGRVLSDNVVNIHSVPVFSVHVGQAWDCRIENCTKCAGIMLACDDGYLYIAANFDKYNHNLSIPHLPKDFKWSIIASTDANVSEEYKSDEMIQEIILNKYSVSIYYGSK